MRKNISWFLRTLVVSLCLLPGCQNNASSTSGSKPSGQTIDLFDSRTGQLLGTASDSQTVARVLEMLEAAPTDRSFNWIAYVERGKMSIRGGDGQETRYVLFKGDRIVELGVDPHDAARIIQVEALIAVLNEQFAKTRPAR